MILKGGRDLGGDVGAEELSLFNKSTTVYIVENA
jgi:hypothetical protein